LIAKAATKINIQQRTSQIAPIFSSPPLLEADESLPFPTRVDGFPSRLIALHSAETEGAAQAICSLEQQRREWMAEKEKCP
jgi:hypothetical protein